MADSERSQQVEIEYDEALYEKAVEKARKGHDLTPAEERLLRMRHGRSLGPENVTEYIYPEDNKGQRKILEIERRALAELERRKKAKIPVRIVKS